MKYKHYPFNLTLTTLSPLHIGSGETLSSTGEYLLTSGHVYFLRHEALMQKLQEMGLFEEYLERIVLEREQFDFYQVLKDWAIDPLELQERRIALHQHQLDPASNNILYLHIKTGDRLYVPGSTLKGLIRQAIIADRLQQEPALLGAIDRELRRQLEEGASRHDLQRYWTSKERSIFNDVLFSAVRCTDSEPLDTTSIGIYQIQRQSLTGQASDGLDWLEECIPPNTSLQVELTYFLPQEGELEGGTFLRTKQPKELLSLLNQWTAMVLDEEERIIETAKLPQEEKVSLRRQIATIREQLAEADDTSAVVRIGKGKTIFAHTLLPLLRPETRRLLIELLAKDAADAFPASLVLTAKDRLLKGYVKLSYQQPVRQIHNNVGEIKEGSTLFAYWVGPKQVELLVNGVHYPAVQLINKFKLRFEPQQRIEVVVRQITKDGRINQVKVKV